MANKFTPNQPERALQRLHGAARQAGLQCLENIWHGWEARYTLLCEQGHQFTRVGSSIVFQSTICQECLRLERLVRLQQAAQAKGGKCLENAYLGAKARHLLECVHGHQWKAEPSRIISTPSWCPHCASIEHGLRLRKQDGLEQLQRIAAEKGGACLSDAYTGGKAYYKFQCAQGHQWDTAGNEVMRGAWCGVCANDAKRQNYLLADGLERLRTAAKNHGGECLSQTYTGGKTKYRFRCSHGHEWESTGHKILRGAWCKQCVYDSKKLGIEVMRQIARDRGGACLSEHYVNSMTKLHWECDRGHRWHAIPGAIRNGHWCRVCAHFNQIRNPKSKARAKYLALPRTDDQSI